MSDAGPGWGIDSNGTESSAKHIFHEVVTNIAHWNAVSLLGTARRNLFVTFSRSENPARTRAVIPQDSDEKGRLSTTTQRILSHSGAENPMDSCDNGLSHKHPTLCWFSLTLLSVRVLSIPLLYLPRRVN